MSTEIAINLQEWESNDTVYNPIAVDDKEGRLSARSMIETYESKLKEYVGSERGEMDDINDEGLTEYFVDGAYVRTLLIPKGVTIVSTLWKKERLWIIASGDVTFTTELGTRRVKAPFVEMAPYGTKVALYAHEDTLWCAITGTDSSVPADVEEEMTTKNYEGFVYPWDKLEDKGEIV